MVWLTCSFLLQCTYLAKAPLWSGRISFSDLLSILLPSALWAARYRCFSMASLPFSYQLAMRGTGKRVEGRRKRGRGIHSLLPSCQSAAQHWLSFSKATVPDWQALFLQPYHSRGSEDHASSCPFSLGEAMAPCCCYNPRMPHYPCWFS